MASLRSDKIADELKKEISLIINRKTKDPRLQNINVTAVKVSDDIGIATVYYSVIGQSINKSESGLENKVLKKILRDGSISIIKNHENKKSTHN